MIQRLGAGVEHERIPFIRGFQIHQIDQVRVEEVGAGQRRFSGGRRGSLDGPDQIDVAVVELERVEVAEGDDAFVGGAGHPRLNEVREKFSLRAALGADAPARGARPVRRFVVNPVERPQVVDDDREGITALVADENERRTVVQDVGLPVVRVNEGVGQTELGDGGDADRVLSRGSPRRCHPRRCLRRGTPDSRGWAGSPRRRRH